MKETGTMPGNDHADSDKSEEFLINMLKDDDSALYEDDIRSLLDHLSDSIDAEVEKHLDAWTPDWRTVWPGEQSAAAIDLSMALSHAQRHVMRQRISGRKLDDDTMRRLYLFYDHTQDVTSYVERFIADHEGNESRADKSRSIVTTYVSMELGKEPKPMDHAAWWLPSVGSWEQWGQFVSTYAGSLVYWQQASDHVNALSALTRAYDAGETIVNEDGDK